MKEVALELCIEKEATILPAVSIPPPTPCLVFFFFFFPTAELIERPFLVHTQASYYDPNGLCCQSDVAVCLHAFSPLQFSLIFDVRDNMT